MSAIVLFFPIFVLLFRLMAAFAVSATARFTRFLCLSASSSLSPLAHTDEQPGRDRIALSSVLKGQSHAHSDTHAHRDRGVHTCDVSARPRNSLTAQTGTESDCRYRCCSSPLLIALFICTFLFLFHATVVFSLTRDRLSEQHQGTQYFRVTVYFWMEEYSLKPY